MGVDNDLYYKPWVLFDIIQTMGFVLFALGIFYKFKIYYQGQRKSIYSPPNYWQMFRAFVGEVILQKQLIGKKILRWFIHILIFYGFLGLMSLSAIAILMKMIPETSDLWLFMVKGKGYDYYKLAGDSFGLMLLFGIVLAFARRYVFRDKQLHSDLNDNVSLILLLALVVTGFMLEAIRISLGTVEFGTSYSFVGNFLAQILRGQKGITSLASLATNLWVLHASLNAIFIAYIPFGKFMHVLNGPIEIALNASEEYARGDLYL